ncbi:hypothetical protein WMY93_015561 [Mugilogobius chulae]|uniref:Fibronectin type-III domain-containing protein n=1 Tax=Mugilogobius chulae TaxID=88201 RepID=A0AAW0NQG3_9GOBI
MWNSLFLLLFFPTAIFSSLPNPINVTFASVNFRNILQWSPGHGTPADTKYSVRYVIYGTKQVYLVQHCTEITRTRCDLSVETADQEEGYIAKVRAVGRNGNSKWVETPRFDPMIDTDFGPPHLSVEVEDKYVIIRMEGPMRYLPHNHTPQVSMATLYPHMKYNLSIHNTYRGEIRHFTLTSKLFKYRILDHGTEYCFSARTKLEDRLMPSKHHSSEWHCVATPEVTLIERLEKIVLISTTVPVVLLCLLAAGAYVLHKYLSGRDEMSPGMLNRSIFPAPAFANTCEKINIVFSNTGIPLNTLYPKLPFSPIVNPSPVPQRRVAPTLNDIIDDSSVEFGDSSVEYGAVSRDDENIEDGYKKKEFEIEAASSGSAYASQNSSVQTSSSSVSLVFLNNSEENQQGLQENSYVSQVQSPNVVSSSGYASHNGTRPINQSVDLPDDYAFVGEGDAEDVDLSSEEQEEEEEDKDFLNVNWSPTTRTLLIPGLDLGVGQREGGNLIWELFCEAAVRRGGTVRIGEEF